MKILITGGAGYIGSHTAVELLMAGYEVVIVDNLANSKRSVVDRIRQITSKDISFFKADLLDAEKLEEVFAAHALEGVIHFAGLKAVGESARMPLRYYHNNLTGTLNLLGLMEKYRVKKMIFSSSATVYGMESTPPFAENLPLSATNPYGRTKLMIEQILQDLYASDDSWSISILRYFNPVGAHESALIGEDPNGEPNNLMPYMLKVAAGEREKLSVFGGDYETPDGTGVRDYIHVADLARGHTAALGTVLESTGIKTYNLGTGVGYSVMDMISSFEKATGVKIPYEVTGRRNGDVPVCFADTGKARRELGWSAEKTLEEMCLDSWRWKSGKQLK